MSYAWTKILQALRARSQADEGFFGHIRRMPRQFEKQNLYQRASGIIYISKHISYINRSYKSFTNIYKSDISRIKKIGIIDSKQSLIPIFFNERIF